MPGPIPPESADEHSDTARPLLHDVISPKGPCTNFVKILNTYSQVAIRLAVFSVRISPQGRRFPIFPPWQRSSEES